jgi:hypothetical protein
MVGTYASDTILLVDVFHMIHVVGMVTGDEVAERFFSLWCDVPRM